MMTNYEKIVNSNFLPAGTDASDVLDTVTKAAEGGTTSFEGLIQALVDAGIISETAASTIVGSANYMDDNIDLGEAIGQTGALAGNLAAINAAPETKSFWYTVTTKYVQSGAGSGSGLMGQAEGGPVSGGTPYIVGEQRAEVFVPGSDGYIFPSISEFEGAFARAMQGNGGTTNYSMNMNVSPSQASQVSQNFDLMKLMR